jgi:hypothetical protein
MGSGEQVVIGQQNTMAFYRIRPMLDSGVHLCNHLVTL